MSGGGGFYFSGFPERPDNVKNVSCEELVIETILIHADEQLLESIQAGDVLAVELKDEAIRIVNGRDVIGDVACDRNESLKKCLEGGTFYVAEVLSNAEGLCKVKIRAELR